MTVSGFMKIYQIIIVAFLALVFIGCNDAPENASPTDVLKNFVEASKKKDIEAIKKTLSKGSLELAEKSAKEENTTVEERFKRDNAMMPDEFPETRNERVEGDAASVEVKDRIGGYDTIPFVRENGAWKIAFDKYNQMRIDKTREEMKMPAPNLSNSDGSNKSEVNK